MLTTPRSLSDIEEAMQRRDVDEISDCIARITEKKLDNELIHEMKVAKKMGKDLATVEKVNSRIDLNLEMRLFDHLQIHSRPVVKSWD